MKEYYGVKALGRTFAFEVLANANEFVDMMFHLKTVEYKDINKEDNYEKVVVPFKEEITIRVVEISEIDDTDEEPFSNE